ncbi:MAG TPA: POTRA domain-containing protein [Candidatus Limnocylindria bacterium]|nr:POTRA domain-containing protein [Candidatus Limnocylindria bacterium]
MTTPRVAAISIFPFYLVVFLALQLHAQEAKPKSDRLVSISGAGSQHYSNEQIAAASGLRSGSTVTRDDLQAGADALSRLGTFSSVQYKFTTISTGIKVEFQVADAPTYPVSFDNFPWFSDAELNAALKAAVGLYDGTAPGSGTILDSMTAALVSLLATRGVQADVAHALVTQPVTGQHVQQFHVEGPALKVEGVEFTDALAKNDHAIRERVADLIGKPFSRSAIELFEFEQIRPIYLAHAFLRVKFGPISTGFTGNPTKPLRDEVLVVAPIDPGPAYTFGRITWTGSSLILPDELEKLVALMPGQVANGNRIELTWEHVRNAYGKLGYLDLNLTPTPAYDDKAASVSYTVSIEEGPQYRMGQLVLTGLSLEGERRIRNAWNIGRDDVFDSSLYEQFITSGIAQAFVGLPVHYEKIGHFLEKDPKTTHVDVLLDFQ